MDRTQGVQVVDQIDGVMDVVHDEVDAIADDVAAEYVGRVAGLVGHLQVEAAEFVEGQVQGVEKVVRRSGRQFLGVRHHQPQGAGGISSWSCIVFHVGPPYKVSTMAPTVSAVRGHSLSVGGLTYTVGADLSSE